jgi:Uma2 family endonuclease
MTAQPARRRFTVHDYYRMAKAGILHEDDRVELIEGEIIEMPPIGSLHSSIVDRLVWLLHQKVNLNESLIRVQEPVRLSAESEPLPDVVIVPFREDFYRQRHPGPDEVLLVIEVADSSLAYEHEVKIPLYGKSGVPEVWVVDANGGAVDVFGQPYDGGYSEHHHFVDSAASLTPTKLPSLMLQLKDILGAS